MQDSAESFLTTRELAELLRIKERKVYDLAAGGEVPCVRVVGKLLFPRAEIEAWIGSGRSGPAISAAAPPPAVVAGSHDPLLERALRDSGSGLAAFFDGSHDGLERFARREAMACGLHIREPSGWNQAAARAAAGTLPVVMVEFARRSRGLIVAAGNPLGIGSVADLRKRRIAQRQSSAASRRLFDALLAEAGLDPAAMDGPADPARTEDELALLVSRGEADAGLGLESSARAFGLGFVPLMEERFDLLVWRRAWFEPPFQALLAYLRGAAFARRAAELGGYRVDGVGTVMLNGAAD